MQVNVPPDVTVALHDPIVAPVPIVVVTVTPGVKPLPAIPTETPLGPCDGVSVMSAGIVIVNGALATSAGTVDASDPVAVTVYIVEEGVPVIVTVQENVPIPDPVGATVAPHDPIEALDPMVVAIVTDPPVAVSGEKPLPDTTTDTPLGPWVGVRVMVGVVTANAAVVWSPLLPSVAVTV